MARFLITGIACAAFLVAATCASGEFAAASAGLPSGQALFKSKCAVCHSDSQSRHSPVGPDLFGVVGRKAGTVAGFHYSKAMAASGLVWNTQNLKRYIANPRATVPGNRMPYAGDHNAAEVDALVAYLVSLK